MIHVLVVDDSKVVHTFVEDCLSGKDCKFDHAYNGEEAIKFLSDQGKYDIVLLDWEMPVMNGLETMKSIKETGVEIPVVMVTTKNKHADIKQMLSEGVKEYVMKPFTKEILVEKIEDVLNKSI
jgi:two-component system chemotaxis response regulator CheY